MIAWPGMPATVADQSGLTAPGLVKQTAFKAGKGTILSAKIPFYFTHSLPGR
jgi:hypothetical protein